MKSSGRRTYPTWLAFKLCLNSLAKLKDRKLASQIVAWLSEAHITFLTRVTRVRSNSVTLTRIGASSALQISRIQTSKFTRQRRKKMESSSTKLWSKTSQAVANATSWIKKASETFFFADLSLKTSYFWRCVPIDSNCITGPWWTLKVSSYRCQRPSIGFSDSKIGLKWTQRSL